MTLSCAPGITRCVPEEKIFFFFFIYCKSSIDQSCLGKLAGNWPRFFLFVFMNFDSVSVHKHAKKELGQYPASLTSFLFINSYTCILKPRSIPNRVKWNCEMMNLVFGSWVIATERPVTTIQGFNRIFCLWNISRQDFRETDRRNVSRFTKREKWDRSDFKSLAFLSEYMKKELACNRG